MVFKRRDKRPILKVLAELLYPKGGWTRAFYYVRHRLRRLPGTPETIARGIWAGVFAAFTPFYGLHFLTAFLISRVLRGNALAAVLATFVGNPLTYLPIGIVSLRSGYWMLDVQPGRGEGRNFLAKFGRAGSDLWHNFLALFTDRRPDWHNLSIFYDEVFLPYLVGGIVPGVLCASLAYYLSVPLIRAYQKRRSGMMEKRRLAKQKKAARRADAAAGKD